MGPARCERKRSQGGNSSVARTSGAASSTHDGMRRSHAPNHDRRVGAARGPAAALSHGHARRTGHAGQHAGLSRRTRVLRGQAREPDPAQQTAALFIASWFGIAVRGGARLPGGPGGRRRDNRDTHRCRQRIGNDCWRVRMPATWRCWAPASKPGVISRPCWRCARCGGFGSGLGMAARQRPSPGSRGPGTRSPSKHRLLCRRPWPVPTSFAR